MTNTLFRSLLTLWGGDKTTVLISTPSGTNDPAGNPQAAPVSSDNPLPVTVIGGGGGGGGSVSFPVVTATYAPQALTVSAAQAQLTVPTGATDATVLVLSGSVRRSIGGAASASTPLLNAGDSETISGAELAAYTLTREGATDAAVSVEYRKVN